MKILDFINNDIAKDQTHVYDTCSMLNEMTTKKIREKTFEETRLKNIIPYAVDRDADVFEEGQNSAVIILNVERVKKFNEKLLKYSGQKYAMLLVSRDSCKTLLESNHKNYLLDAYACAVSKGIMYANDEPLEYRKTYGALLEIYGQIISAKPDTDDLN